MPEPAFSETLQIGIVVPDLETAMRSYVDDHGIGPWEIVEFHAGKAEALHEHGRPVERSWRLATAMVGAVQWELIEPLDDESDYARFLAEKGAASTILLSARQTSTRRWRTPRRKAKRRFSAARSAPASGSRTYLQSTISA
jgi:methylmalonyl-CoA/ethylmalonyl-CoA epimerase